MSGVLGVLPRQLAVDGGVFVPGAQLFVYNTGTTTKRAIYTTAALSVEHSNPLEADANGRFATFYVNPSGGAYKFVLAPDGDTDPPASPLYTDDAIPASVPVEALPSSVSTLVEGQFTGTLTGMTGATTGTVKYKIVANAAGTGKLCILSAAAQISGTSNTTAMTMTGLPAACVPTDAVFVPCVLLDNGTNAQSAASISASGATIVFFTDDPYSTTGFTNSGTKGLPAGWVFAYPL